MYPFWEVRQIQYAKEVEITGKKGEKGTGEGFLPLEKGGRGNRN